MTATTVDTHFAPAGRDDEATLCILAARVDGTELVRETVSAIPHPVLILNDKRQVVVANRALVCLLKTEEAEIRGRRPGEILQCANAKNGPDGCGTGPHCRACGAVAAILGCQESKHQTTCECRLTTRTPSGPKALDLRVTASPLRIDSGEFTIVVLEDIGKQKRLDVLTHTFFHDVLNTAGGIRGFAQLLEEDLPPDSAERNEARHLGAMADRLIDQIECQRDLIRAEDGQLTVAPEPVRVTDLLDELRTLYSAHQVGSGREIAIGPCWDGSLLIDPRLLARVLGNMLKNALEATPRDGRVALRCEELDHRVAFHVDNSAVMPEEIRLQIFQRSFSTKGEAGRGIGTYSIKLFGETYLGGRVSFTSRAPDGTTFTLVVPKVRLDTTGKCEDDHDRYSACPTVKTSPGVAPNTGTIPTA